MMARPADDLVSRLRDAVARREADLGLMAEAVTELARSRSNLRALAVEYARVVDSLSDDMGPAYEAVCTELEMNPLAPQLTEPDPDDE